MKNNVTFFAIIFFVIISICNNQKQKLPSDLINQQILSRESIQPVKVTDETGKKCTLKLAKLNEKYTGVYFREADPTSVFGQIDNGHYYYLK